MTHDFKKALNAAEYFCAGQMNEKCYQAIRTALLIADKLMQEPSIEMVAAAIREGDTTNYYRFKAMRDQMLREIDKQNNIKVIKDDNYRASTKQPNS